MTTKLKTPDDLSFGDFIKCYRLGEEMSQAELAELLGVSKQRVCDMEKNRFNTSLKLAKQIALCLELSPEWLAKLVLMDQIKKEGLNLKVK
jgi:DNA-binding XRE family transcriptional regulator